ncbi:hypothetical protein X907_1375 [Glycocaulis alkaliphilus]|uniref:Uncharacterized protein n=2 Tax=Glycocaulis alkaliphilus TaxID=1434191 RepID=A0A3T0EA33_9PROT|nr:hypothetical protein X907_1375 [Glycocaulis alkaliphilus]
MNPSAGESSMDTQTTKPHFPRSRWIPDGVYVVRFRSPLDQSGGVVTVRNGRATGGDSSYYYDGYLGEGSNGPVARMLFVRHRPETVSVVGDVERFSVVYDGRVDGELYHLEGRMDRAPGLKLTAIMSRLPVELED